MVPSCAEGGVLGVLPGIIGCIQATEILKLALGKGTSLIGRLLLFNALDMKFRELKLRRDPEVPVCGDNPTIKELIDYEQFCGIVPEPVIPAHNPDEVTVQDMKKALDDPKLGIKVIDVREPDEYEIAHVDGVPLIPLEPAAAALHRARSEHADLPPLQDRRALDEGPRIPAPAGLQVREERQGRHQRVERRDRPQRAEVLTGDPPSRGPRNDGHRARRGFPPPPGPICSGLPRTTFPAWRRRLFGAGLLRKKSFCNRPRAPQSPAP